MSDPAHILFPSDTPASSQPPEWFMGQQNAATARLMRTEKPAGDDAAARLFSNDTAQAEDNHKVAGSDVENAADTLFPGDTKIFDDARSKDFFNGFANSAAADGDVERMQALNSAGEALIANARAAGTDAAELASALDIVRERQGDTIAPMTEEKMEAEFASGMAAIQSEYGESYMDDLSAARAFVRDLEIVAPGTIDSLERTGAGNDVRLIRTVIKEARRRGYRASK